MSVTEPKVEHHEGRGVRSVPLFPELFEVLERAYHAAPEGAVYVVDKQAYRDAAMGPQGWVNSNLRTQFLKKLKKAGVAPWPRLFHSMRASRETELEREHPRHVVCAWIGNSSSAAERSYLLVTEDDFAKAISSGTKSGTASSTQEPRKERENTVNSRLKSRFPREFRGKKDGGAGTRTTPENTGKTGPSEEVARNPARFAKETSELLEIFQSLDDAGRADLLAVARGLAERQQP